MLLRHVYRPLPVYSAPQRHPHLTSLLLSSLSPPPPPSFTSRTHPRLPLLDRSYDFDAVKSWTKKRKMKFGGTFDMDLLIVPVHIGVHWTLAVVNLPQRRIEYYDALHDPPAEDTVQALRDWLNDESLDKRGEAFDASDFEVYVPHDVPGQKNATDCGMFMCMYVYSRGEGGRYLSCICLCNSVCAFQTWPILTLIPLLPSHYWTGTPCAGASARRHRLILNRKTSTMFEYAPRWTSATEAISKTLALQMIL